jgi:hypothetical protein
VITDINFSLELFSQDSLFEGFDRIQSKLIELHSDFVP